MATIPSAFRKHTGLGVEGHAAWQATRRERLIRPFEVIVDTSMASK